MSILPIPERLNVVTLAFASAACGSFLWIASHASGWLWIAIAALGFSFTANTMFALLHESVHGLFSCRRWLNESAGVIAGAWFPTGLSIQRAFHLTHHRNNRGPAEQFDYFQPGEIRWLKRAQWYAILTGVYWIVAVIGVLVFAITPREVRMRARKRRSIAMHQTSGSAYLAALDTLPPIRARAEIVFALGFQIAVIAALDLSIIGWLACYGGFALQWSSLQYADHAFSPLDPREGAWNLRVSPIARAFFLNYHLHLAHHREPRTSWIHLPSLVDPREPQPYFWAIWAAMWRGPRPMPEERRDG